MNNEDTLGKELILHVGHGKTGSSYLQSVLAENRLVLEKYGYCYPEHRSFKDALAGKPSAGNGLLVLQNDFVLDQSTLVSSERLFFELAKEAALESLISKLDGKLTVVLYTRNVFEMLTSVWGQWVKKIGYTSDLNSHLLELSDRHYPNVLFWLQASEKFGFELRVRNYSNHRHDFLPSFFSTAFPNLSQKVLEEFTVSGYQKVNRSLTESEYVLLSEFNKHGPRTAGFLADALVHKIPDIDAEMPFIELDVYEKVCAWITPTIQAINASLPSTEHVEVESYAFLQQKMNADSAEHYQFTKHQLEVIAEEAAAKINHGPFKLTHMDAEYLRDIALKIERGEMPVLEDAYQLMLLAQRSRPDGIVINAKIREYEAQLKREETTKKEGE